MYNTNQSFNTSSIKDQLQAMNKIKIYITLLALSCLWWLTYGEKEKIAIDLKTCEPEGLFASYRSFVLGRDFKINQINALRRDILLNQKLDELDAEWAEKMQKIREESPALNILQKEKEYRIKNSPPEYRTAVIAQIQAEEAKEQAEKIKSDADWKFIKELRNANQRRNFTCIEKLTKEVE